MADSAKTRVGFIGFGYWGPNLARNIARHPEAQLAFICDIDESNRKRAAMQYPDVRVTDNSSSILADDDIDAVIIATPAGTHDFLVKAALAAGKHVLVTKPVSTSSTSARSMTALAASSKKTLLVDHTFLYSNAVESLKEILDSGVLGKPLYYDATRTGLGIFKNDVDVIADLAVHDMAIVDFLFDERPVSVSAVSAASISGHLPSLAYVNFNYSSGLHVHMAANWISPIKQRKIIIAGSEQMLCWDDAQRNHALCVYNSGVFESLEPVVAGRAPLNYRSGEPRPVELLTKEALASEVDDFIASIRENRQPRSDGNSATRVMQMAEAAGLSARQGGKPININW